MPTARSSFWPPRQLDDAPSVNSAIDKTEVFATILERAANALGDLNPTLMQQFYRRFPETSEAFVRHGLGNPPKLEVAMVDATLYCVMQWLERPSEVRLIFADQVPHHCETLQIERDWFAGLVEELVLLISSTVPESQPDQQALCTEITSGLCGAIKSVPARKRRNPA